MTIIARMMLSTQMQEHKNAHIFEQRAGCSDTWPESGLTKHFRHLSRNVNDPV